MPTRNVALHASLLLLSTLLAAPVQASTITFYTTDDYDAQSTSEDMAVSCKNMFLNGQTIGASCNKKTTSGSIAPHSTTLDLTTVAYCKDDQGLANTVITWGSGTSSFSMTGVTIGLDSVGDEYVFTATCKNTAGAQGPAAGLVLSDTTNGLKNNDGSLAKR